MALCNRTSSLPTSNSPLRRSTGFGPRVRIEGLRALTGVPHRALGNRVKPMGLTPPQLASLCLTFARAGIDIVEDVAAWRTSLLAPFGARIGAVRAVEQAARETGRRTLYVPNLIGSPSGLPASSSSRAAPERAVGMISPMLVGLGLLHELASAADGVPMVAHPALGGALSEGVGALRQGVPLVRRRCGDLSPRRRPFSYSEETCRGLAEALRAPDPRRGLPADARWSIAVHGSQAC